MAQRTWKHPKPVIGLAGGIGSGKSTIARQFAALRCAVVDSDALSHEVLESTAVRDALRAWLGEGIFGPDGKVMRRAVAQRIFGDVESTKRLNGLIHPLVGKLREELTAAAMADRGVKAVVWDSPLLFETGLEKECDAIVFVKTSLDRRLERVRAGRGWGEAELSKREKLQIPLDKKADVADYVIDNSGDEAASLRQVQQVLSQLLASVV